jgi:ferredoxin
MKIIVDFDMCAATGGCVNQAPEVFEIRDDGFLYVLQENPNESLREKVKLAEDLCPTGAITIND